ncbi:MAG: hypothetical protein ACE5I1_09225 [bacterium]
MLQAYHHTMLSPVREIMATMRRMWIKCNEIVYNINTLPCQPFEKKAADGRPWQKGDYSPKARYDDNTWYESPDYWYLRKIARIVRPIYENEGVFYDLGSGKGRILCLMSRLPFRRVVGIELFEDLCIAARKNDECLSQIMQ